VNGKILILSTATGIMATCLVFLIADVFFNVLPDDTSAVVIALFIGSGSHLLMRHLLDRGQINPGNQYKQLNGFRSFRFSGG
jgi:hypothetical protein